MRLFSIRGALAASCTAVAMAAASTPARAADPPPVDPAIQIGVSSKFAIAGQTIKVRVRVNTAISAIRLVQTRPEHLINPAFCDDAKYKFLENPAGNHFMASTWGGLGTLAVITDPTPNVWTTVSVKATALLFYGGDLFSAPRPNTCLDRASQLDRILAYGSAGFPIGAEKPLIRLL